MWSFWEFPRSRDAINRVSTNGKYIEMDSCFRHSSAAVGRSVGAVLATVLLAWPAMANSSADHAVTVNWWGLGSQYAHDPALGWSFITFGLFVAGVFKLSKHRLAQHIHERAERVEQAIATNRQAYQQAHHMVQQSQQRLAGLDQEVEQIRSAAKAAGERQLRQARQQVEQQAQRIKQRVRQEVEGQQRLACARVQREWVEQALTQALEEVQAKPSGELAQMDHRLQSMLHEDLQNPDPSLSLPSSKPSKNLGSPPS
ncbi:MAG: ATP synthase F0 subunit B [Myxococcota bacterium]